MLYLSNEIAVLQSFIAIWYKLIDMNPKALFDKNFDNNFGLFSFDIKSVN